MELLHVPKGQDRRWQEPATGTARCLTYPSYSFLFLDFETGKTLPDIGSFTHQMRRRGSQDPSIIALPQLGDALPWRADF